MAIMPSLVIVAGPNGCGKSTLTEIGRFGSVEIIDPDAIARDLRRGGANGAEIAAAREALRRQRQAIADDRSFLVETTMAGRGTHRLMKLAGSAGYRIGLHYVCVNTPGLALNRVRSRVALGGHDVPKEDIVRRFSRSLANLPMSMALSHSTNLYDNSNHREPHRWVALVDEDQCTTVENCPAWASHAVEGWRSLQREMRRSTGRGMGQEF